MKRSALSNRFIGNKEVIVVSEAVDYVKQMGYLVIKPKTYKMTFTILTFLIMFIALASFTSATKYSGVNSDSNWTFDLTSNNGTNTGLNTLGFGDISFSGGNQNKGSGCIDSNCLNYTMGSATLTNPNINQLNGTLVFWIKPTTNATPSIWTSVGGGVVNSGIDLKMASNGSLVWLADGGGTETTINSPALNLEVWNLVELKINNTGRYIFLNGTLVNSIIESGKGWVRTGSAVTIMADLQDTLDEMRFYSAELNESQLLDIYLVESGTPTATINVTKISPTANFSSTSSSVTFEVNLTSTISELKNVSLYIYNSSNNLIQTNSTNLSGFDTLATFIHNFSNGNYYYHFEGYTNDLTFASSGNHSFSVSVTPITTTNATSTNVIVGNLGNFKRNDCITIKAITSNNLTITDVSNPNSTIIYINSPMTKNGIVNNYTFCKTQLIGLYNFDLVDTSGVLYSGTFTISDKSTSILEFDFSSTINIIMFIILLLIAITLILFRFILWGSVIFILCGFIVLFSGASVIVGAILIIAGVILAGFKF